MPPHNILFHVHQSRVPNPFLVIKSDSLVFLGHFIGGRGKTTKLLVLGLFLFLGVGRWVPRRAKKTKKGKNEKILKPGGTPEKPEKGKRLEKAKKPKKKKVCNNTSKKAPSGPANDRIPIHNVREERGGH